MPFKNLKKGNKKEKGAWARMEKVMEHTEQQIREAKEVQDDYIWDLLGARLDNCLKEGDIHRLTFYINMAKRMLE